MSLQEVWQLPSAVCAGRMSIIGFNLTKDEINKHLLKI
nr:MAG TPA: hypothetical protein [Caudoviricetes sp.]